MTKIIIDGKKISAPDGTTVLTAAREHGIEIPTLCSHEALEQSGACRFCVVEIKKGKRSRIVTSCLYPVEEGLEVNTKSERVLGVRRLVLQLLMARNPTAEVIRDLAAQAGITPEPRFTPDKDKGKCILCRQCVRTCEHIVGVSAIGLSHRGSQKKVGPPFGEDSPTCIGCGACAYVCPTGHIVMRDVQDERKIWGRTFKMQACKVCGRYFAPADQLAYISKTTGVAAEDLTTCTSCR
jgi:NADH dehydrogenase/NADH:ubiquinone oxidoreductase subunit G